MSRSVRFYNKACHELFETIKNYDSDTFCAQECKITENELFEIAAKCIHSFIDNNLDGTVLRGMLEDIRD